MRLRPPVVALGLAYAAAGFVAVWAPWKLAFANGWTRAENPVDGFQAISLPLLFLVGVLGGSVAPRVSHWVALSTMAAFPAKAIVEMILDPTSHNLWPFEFVFYGGEALFAVGGAALARWVRRRPSSESPPPA